MREGVPSREELERVLDEALSTRGEPGAKIWIHSKAFWRMVHRGQIHHLDGRFRRYSYTGKMR